ncbi:hypothetical protein Ddye_011498 [Dipteronia dyeriana]|uniref:Fatty acid desaturase domain-containing protein n=1 Tax=Dipteronia dyeriana TaxID=168575 RepID=A0AAE0CH41_9ROSI|nr:hypothetical protein Ddye_011498 [Dipteronia dyeriana]
MFSWVCNQSPTLARHGDDLGYIRLLGITLSYHRNLSHRSFKLPKWLEYMCAYCGVQALQGDPISWVSTHKYHHRFCDSERDPHSPIEGFWFSHMSWLFDSNGFSERCGRPSNVGDLEKQPFYKFLENTYILHPIALGVLLYALGGVPFLVWGMGVRIVWVFHITWLVNSGCHVWGNQAWNTRDLSRNNWWVSITLSSINDMCLGTNLSLPKHMSLIREEGNPPLRGE